MAERNFEILSDFYRFFASVSRLLEMKEEFAARMYYICDCPSVGRVRCG